MRVVRIWPRQREHAVTKQGVGARFGRRVSGWAVECGIVRVQLSIAVSEVRLHCMCLARDNNILLGFLFSFFSFYLFILTVKYKKIIILHFYIF